LVYCQAKKKAMEMRAVLELVMAKVGILRQVLNQFITLKAEGAYTDKELAEIDPVDHSLVNLIHNIEESFEFVTSIATATIHGDRSPRRR